MLGRQATGQLGFGDLSMDMFYRYGGHKYADQCNWQKNLVQGAMVLAPFSDCIDADFLAAGPGRGNASGYGFG